MKNLNLTAGDRVIIRNQVEEWSIQWKMKKGKKPETVDNPTMSDQLAKMFLKITIRGHS